MLPHATGGLALAGCSTSDITHRKANADGDSSAATRDDQFLDGATDGDQAAGGGDRLRPRSTSVWWAAAQCRDAGSRDDQGAVEEAFCRGFDADELASDDLMLMEQELLAGERALAMAALFDDGALAARDEARAWTSAEEFLDDRGRHVHRLEAD